jgi:hypothetical protein
VQHRRGTALVWKTSSLGLGGICVACWHQLGLGQMPLVCKLRAVHTVPLQGPLLDRFVQSSNLSGNEPQAILAPYFKVGIPSGVD